MTIDEQKLEAISRMNMMKLHSNVIREFQDEDKLNLSDGGGFLYWLNEEQNNIVKKFEKEYNAVVYHVIHDITDFGELLSLLYVSCHKEEWEIDRSDIKDGYPLAYVVNLSEEAFSEFGSIGVRQSFGGLVRTA